MDDDLNSVGEYWWTHPLVRIGMVILLLAIVCLVCQLTSCLPMAQPMNCSSGHSTTDMSQQTVIIDGIPHISTVITDDKGNHYRILQEYDAYMEEAYPGMRHNNGYQTRRPLAPPGNKSPRPYFVDHPAEMPDARHSGSPEYYYASTVGAGQPYTGPPGLFHDSRFPPPSAPPLYIH